MISYKIKKRISNTVYDGWKLKRFHGDISKICAMSGLKRHEVSLALNSGYCTDETEKKIFEYFEKDLGF